MSQILPSGTQAPDFALHVTPGQTISLSEFKGRPVIPASYPADWSPVCGDQMALYNEILPEFRKYGAEAPMLWGASPQYCLRNLTMAHSPGRFGA